MKSHPFKEPGGYGVRLIRRLRSGTRDSIVDFKMAAGPLHVGWTVDPYWMSLTCCVDDVCVYERILAASEIRRLVSP